MIVPMKKASLVIHEPDVQKALKRLRKLGVFHIESFPQGSGEDLEKMISTHEHLVGALSFLDSSIKPKTSANHFDRDSTDQMADDIWRIHENLNRLHGQLAQISAQIDSMRPFGDFEPADVKILSSKGINIRLFDADEASMRLMREEAALFYLLRKKKKRRHFAAVFIGEAPENPISGAVELPESSISTMLMEKEGTIKEIKELKRHLEDYSLRSLELSHYLAVLQQEIEFERLSTGMEGEGALVWLTGYVPDSQVESVRILSSREGWALLLREPEPDDSIPTLVKNSPLIRVIQPVFSFLGTLPGYREYDISLYFLAYFSIFFAMIIGDAGYGLVFFLAAFLLAVRSLHKRGAIPDATKLLFLLSVATIIWGAITGNWFGSRYLASQPLLRRLTVPGIATYPELFPEVEADPQKTIMWLCFLLGLTQLTLANLMNFFRKFPALQSFSDLGWGSVIGGLYFLVLNLVIGVTLPQFTIYMVLGGVVLVIIFGAQSRGISFARGLINGFGGAFTTFLDTISGFSRVISYIRLFAVGMSSFYIASSFNNLAAPMLEGWLIPLGIVIIAIGHALNLIMGLLSVVVHGIRLNMLEFSGQLGMEWTGIEYNPFRVRVSEERNNTGVST